jgi:DNA-binding transcriptional regulator YiaG
MSTKNVGADHFFCYDAPMISAEQSRAARGWLDWSQQELADRAHVALSTVRDFEKGRRRPISNNLDAIRLSLEMAGVSFEFHGDVPLGIKVKAPA